MLTGSFRAAAVTMDAHTVAAPPMSALIASMEGEGLREIPPLQIQRENKSFQGHQIVFLCIQVGTKRCEVFTCQMWCPCPRAAGVALYCQVTRCNEAPKRPEAPLNLWTHWGRLPSAAPWSSPGVWKQMISLLSYFLFCFPTNTQTILTSYWLWLVRHVGLVSPR